MLRVILLSPLILLGACADPGILRGPIGITTVRTAYFRIAPLDRREELLLFLSNGIFPECALPSLPDDPDLEAGIVGPIVQSLCRETAQHVILSAYDVDRSFTGTYEAGIDAEVGDVGITVPRFARVSYYGVDEAALFRFTDDTIRYLATRSVSLDPVPGLGEVALERLGDGRLRAAFDLPDVSGEVVARPCPGDTQLIDIAAEIGLVEICG